MGSLGEVRNLGIQILLYLRLLFEKGEFKFDGDYGKNLNSFTNYKKELKQDKSEYNNYKTKELDFDI
ncbi:15945_t:CDS:2 [Funneliformis caledonium]|uniref:15945_t:CDS:1 n=1 Tax=Funneliformis caledonium TaxID=1117310 RepID=A0A9N9H365_9GLOM|nr:15945_t:CDS:2 [Funneliformis caledonium]